MSLGCHKPGSNSEGRSRASAARARVQGMMNGSINANPNPAAQMQRAMAMQKRAAAEAQLQMAAQMSEFADGIMNGTLNMEDTPAARVNRQRQKKESESMGNVSGRIGSSSTRQKAEKVVGTKISGKRTVFDSKAPNPIRERLRQQQERQQQIETNNRVYQQQQEQYNEQESMNAAAGMSDFKGFGPARRQQGGQGARGGGGANGMQRQMMMLQQTMQRNQQQAAMQRGNNKMGRGGATPSSMRQQQLQNRGRATPAQTQGQAQAAPPKKRVQIAVPPTQDQQQDQDYYDDDGGGGGGQQDDELEDDVDDDPLARLRKARARSAKIKEENSKYEQLEVQVSKVESSNRQIAETLAQIIEEGGITAAPAGGGGGSAADKTVIAAQKKEIAALQQALVELSGKVEELGSVVQGSAAGGAEGAGREFHKKVAHFESQLRLRMNELTKRDAQINTQIQSVMGDLHAVKKQHVDSTAGLSEKIDKLMGETQIAWGRLQYATCFYPEVPTYDNQVDPDMAKDAGSAVILVYPPVYNAQSGTWITTRSFDDDGNMVSRWIPFKTTLRWITGADDDTGDVAAIVDISLFPLADAAPPPVPASNHEVDDGYEGDAQQPIYAEEDDAEDDGSGDSAAA